MDDPLFLDIANLDTNGVWSTLQVAGHGDS